jgi:hypothetical protein
MATDLSRLWLISIRSVRYWRPPVVLDDLQRRVVVGLGVVEIPLPGVWGDDRGGT